MTGLGPAVPVAIEDAYPAYLRCLSRQDERAAIRVALDLCGPDIDTEQVLLQLVARAMVQVGRWWQGNVWTVAQEHAASYICGRVVAALAGAAPPEALDRPDPARRVVVSCIERELHATPALLFAETLQLRGRTCVFLGADVPSTHLVSFLRRDPPAAVALSCSLPMRLPQAQRVIDACRRSDVPVIAGGRAFGPDGRWAGRLGVAWAANGAAAIPLLDQDDQLRGYTGGVPVDDEYLALLHRRSELIDRELGRLGATHPQLTADGFPYDMTVTDLGYLLDHLAAAVFVGDVSLFTGFTTWLADILGSRGVPAEPVEATLLDLAGVLHDHPQSRRFLQAGQIAYSAANVRR